MKTAQSVTAGFDNSRQIDAHFLGPLPFRVVWLFFWGDLKRAWCGKKHTRKH